MATKSLYLFPGAHKTATSLLQFGLEKNRELFENDGLAIAKRSVYYQSGLRNDLLKPNCMRHISADDMKAKLVSVFGRDPREHDALISIENAFGEISPNIYNGAETYVDNIQEMFPDHEIKITFYVRRQDEFLESAYVQTIHRGIEVPLDTFFLPYRDTVLDWFSVIKPIRRKLGRRNVKIIPYETIRAGSRKYITAFFKRFSDLPKQDLMNAVDLSDADTNLTLSEVGIKLACNGFSVLPEMPARRRLVRALQREFGVDRYPRFRIPDELRKDIAERHLEANELLISHKQIPEQLHAYYRFET